MKADDCNLTPPKSASNLAKKYAKEVRYSRLTCFSNKKNLVNLSNFLNKTNVTTQAL